MNFNARELAKFISDFEPSTEQTEIIEYSSESPLLIIAGAGSGKTATMAQKILYLIVNEIVKPEEILCLTFTKKAVSELSSRIRAKMFSYQSKLNENQNLRTAEFEDFPQVSTYDSFSLFSC